MASAMKLPAPPLRIPSSTVTTKLCRPASATITGSSGRTTRTSHSVASTPSSGKKSGGFLGGFDQLADRQDADRPVARADQPGAQARSQPGPPATWRAAVLG